MIERLIRLSQDRKLIENLAHSAGDNTRHIEEENRSLLRSEEERFKECQTKVNGLFSSLSFAPNDEIKRMTYDKIEELNQERKAVEANISDLKERQVDNVVDLEGVFRVLKNFNRGFRESQPHIQRDLIRDVVSGVIITGPGQAKINYYKNAREEEIFPGSALSVLFLNSEESQPITNPRSGVRTVQRMVDPIGIEPTAFALRTQRSPS